jgi:hypothetical protein
MHKKKPSIPMFLSRPPSMDGRYLDGCLAVLGDLSSAELAVRPGANLIGLIASVVASVQITGLARVDTRVGDMAGIPIVGVNTTQHTPILSDNVVNDDIARPAVPRTVAARPGKLAVVLDVVVFDADVDADAVDLDDLVVGGEGAAADGDGVFADVLEPDIGDGAGAKAVDALGLVGADDDVGDGGAVLEDEDGVFGAGLVLPLADDGCFPIALGWHLAGWSKVKRGLTISVVEEVLAVKGAADGDGLGGQAGARRRGDVARGGLGEGNAGASGGKNSSRLHCGVRE